jgi:hypothetical protein
VCILLVFLTYTFFDCLVIEDEGIRIIFSIATQSINVIASYLWKHECSVDASYWGIVSFFFWQRDFVSLCPYLLLYTVNKERAWLFVLWLACSSMYDAENRSNTCQNFKWFTHFNGNNKADYRVLVYKHDTSLHFQERLYVTLFQVVYCAITELCFVLVYSSAINWNICVKYLVNIMILECAYWTTLPITKITDRR